MTHFWALFGPLEASPRTIESRPACMGKFHEKSAHFSRSEKSAEKFDFLHFSRILHVKVENEI